MDHRHLWLRSKRQHAIVRVRHTIIKAVRDFFDDRGFTLVDAPIFTPNACEGTSTLFETDYHGDKAYLTQSGQLYMEAAAAAFGSVYCFGPTFRAEKSKTRRHLAEFWMVEPEVAFMDLDGDMRLAEEFIAFVVGRVLETRREELKVLERDTTKLEKVQAPFPRITYARGDRASCRRTATPRPRSATTSAATRRPSSRRSSTGPCIVHRYPMELKAFYFKRDPDDDVARAQHGRARARGVRRDHRRRAARGRPREARGRDRRATSCRARRSSGTSTSAATGRSRTPASGSASSARSRGCAACRTCARRSRFRGCSTAWPPEAPQSAHGAPSRTRGARLAPRKWRLRKFCSPWRRKSYGSTSGPTSLARGATSASAGSRRRSPAFRTGMPSRSCGGPSSWIPPRPA